MDEVFADVDEVLKLSRDFRERIEFSEISWTTESEALRLFESQLGIFETTKDLVNKNRYVEDFILNRTICKNFFLISLMSKGTKYLLRDKVPDRPIETPKQAYFQLAGELEKRRLKDGGTSFLLDRSKNTSR